MRGALALVLALAPAPLAAQPGPWLAARDACWAAGGGTECAGRAADPCMEADSSTVGMIGCLVDEADGWRARIALMLADLRKRAAAQDASPPEPAAPDPPSALAALDRVVGLWQDLIEARCTYEVIPYLGGTIRGPMGAGCRLEGVLDLAAYLAGLLSPVNDH